MGLYDFILADVKCPKCNNINESLDCQTKEFDKSMARINIGTAFDKRRIFVKEGELKTIASCKFCEVKRSSICECGNEFEESSAFFFYPVFEIKEGLLGDLIRVDREDGF